MGSPLEIPQLVRSTGPERMILSKKKEVPDVVAVFGFGSFFRCSCPKDCDLLIVIADSANELGSLHGQLNSMFQAVGQTLESRSISQF